MRPGFDPSAAAVGGGIYGLSSTPEDARVVLLPVPWEATVSYGAGASDGPRAILEASRQVDLRDRDTGRPYESGIAMLPIPPEVRAWSDEARRRAQPVIAHGGPGEQAELREAAAGVDALSERVNHWVHEQCARWLQAGKLVGVVGGDHSAPFGGMRAAAELFPGLGVLHVDAHADLRDGYEGFRWSHASIMFNVARDVPGVERIVQVGIRDYSDDEDALIRENPERLRTYFESDLRRLMQDGENWTRLMGRVVADLPARVWISFDIDGLDPALCPHTGTPVPGGLSFAEMVGLLRMVVSSGRRVVGFDLSEVSPGPAGGSEWDANVGARVLYKLIGFALMSQAATRGLGGAAT
jgi:agmatinase